ncbi:MAG: hypothetical protein K6F53_12275 [Lachnospiraceae bacterium]|nr:hypothetical protein [Lachnospiraceae bacterium]
MKEEKFTKKKKPVVRRVLQIALAAILALLVLNVCGTEISAHRIPHRFASAKEGRDRLLANTRYYGQFTQNDIDYRMKKSGATIDELLKASADEIGDFSLFDKYIIDRNIARMARSLRKNGYELPKLQEIVYIRTDMTTEGIAASGYTHGNEIYLNSTNVLASVIPGAGEYFYHLMWHELFHCLTRNNPDFRADMYSLIHFTVGDSDYEIPPCLQEKVYSNPDVEHHDSYATFVIDGRETECFVAWIVTEDYAEGQSSRPDTMAVLVPTDGTDTYYSKEQVSNFDEVFGKNTDNVSDPEECMADNFADAMQYGMEGRNGQGYPNPEIIQGIIDILKK